MEIVVRSLVNLLDFLGILVFVYPHIKVLAPPGTQGTNSLKFCACGHTHPISK
jgi:hypothetical protein